MQEFKKNKKRHARITVIMGVLIVICFIAGVCLELLAEIDNTIALVLFMVALGLVVIGFLCLVLFYKIDGKVTEKMLEQLNQSIDKEYSYDYKVTSIMDLLQDSMYPILYKNTTAYTKESISGKIDDISFEYYVFKYEKESFFLNNQKGLYELYIYKDSSVFSKEFFVTKDQLKEVGEFKETSLGYIYIYTKKNEEFSEENLPSDVFFLSMNERTLFVFKKALSKQLLYMQAETLEEFKELFTKEIDKIKTTYEETRNWTKWSRGVLK